MDGSTLAIFLVLPFAAVFVYAAWHENRRYRQEGRSTYGLTYDPDSNTTYVGTIEETKDHYDPEDFDPTQSDPSDAGTPDKGGADHMNTDDNAQDGRK